MSEDQKPEIQKREEVKPVFKDLPSRKEVRSILKTGKGQEGLEVHPRSRQLLRTARLADLESLGDDVNKANKALYDLLISLSKGMDEAISADRTNFFAFVSFLIEKKILGEDAMEEYYKFKADFIDNLNKAGEFLKQKEEEIEKQKAEMIAKANAEGKPVEEKKIILP